MPTLPIYIGLWNDYSHNAVNRVTLTLPVQLGAYLVSALAILVSLAGTSMWVVLAYVFHQARVKHDKPADPLHLQIQTLLRNNGSPISALRDAYSISSAWSHTPFRAKRRLAPIIAGTLLVTVVFKVAAVFVAAIATRGEADGIVLANPTGCGSWNFNWTRLYSDASLANQTGPPSPEALVSAVNDTLNARAYAKWFYSDVQPLAVPVSIYPAKTLPYTRKTVPCPFAGEHRCLSNDTSSPNIALQLDTAILDSHSHLGINAPIGDRIQLRRVLTCAPVNTTDLVSSFIGENGDIYFDISQLANFSTLLPFSPNRKVEMNGYTAGQAHSLNRDPSRK